MYAYSLLYKACYSSLSVIFEKVCIPSVLEQNSKLPISAIAKTVIQNSESKITITCIIQTHIQWSKEELPIYIYTYYFSLVPRPYWAPREIVQWYPLLMSVGRNLQKKALNVSMNNLSHMARSSMQGDSIHVCTWCSKWRTGNHPHSDLCNWITLRLKLQYSLVTRGKGCNLLCSN